MLSQSMLFLLLADQEPSPEGIFGALAIIGIFAMRAIRNSRSLSELKKRHATWIGQKKRLRVDGASSEAWESWLHEGEQIMAKCKGRKKLGALAEQIREDLRAYESARAVASMNASTPSLMQPEMVAELAKLRSSGQITGEEFDAFTERFRRSSGSKAREIIQAIEELHGQHKSGAMSQGNYKASLWTLMDRLDRELK